MGTFSIDENSLQLFIVESWTLQPLIPQREEGPPLPEVEIDIDSDLFLIEGDVVDETRISQLQNRFEKGLQVIQDWIS